MNTQPVESDTTATYMDATMRTVDGSTARVAVVGEVISLIADPADHCSVVMDFRDASALRDLLDLATNRALSQRRRKAEGH
jgi:hypothetical protein